jgi:Carboxypeptidase regulatory-like domain/TonB-dependent Receptor Plug Domain
MLTIQISKQGILTAAAKAARQSPVRSAVLGLLAFLPIVGGLAIAGLAQSASTGAVSGTVTDPANAVVVGAKITATNQATGEKRTVDSGSAGAYFLPFLPPGTYSLEASAKGFKQVNYPDLRVVITETVKLDIRLAVGAVAEVVTVESRAAQLQTESTNLGQVTSGEVLNSLPLVTRNYTQIIALNPGVASDVTNASAVGKGGNGSIETGSAVVAHGVSGQDNNYQMNGVEINDLQSSGHFSGGVAIPNPDAIQEFKVQTGQYDASYGRNAGANVDVITKGGGNAFHGTIFEYLRNEDLNANDFFFNKNGQPRGILRQNQPGFTFGGPIKKDKLLFFTSYQATRQRNGLAPECSTSFSGPPLTNDRSAAALGALFAGQPTFIQILTGAPIGPTVLANGSNISTQALALMQMKLPNGQFLIPTPQKVDPSKPFALQGTSSFSNPCSYNEDQFITNADFLHNEHNTFSGKFFWANGSQNTTFPATNLGGPTAPGFPTVLDSGYRNFSLTYTHTFSPNMLNQAEVAFHRSTVALSQQEAFTFPGIGVNAPAFDNQPAINITGALTLGGNGQSVDFAQNTFVYQDVLSYSLGRHTLRFGGGLTRAQDNETNFQFLGGLIFGTFPDFLLGQSAAQNGTPLSNVLASVDIPGLFGRAWRIWDGDLFVQDDFKVTRTLTLNLGFRYERLGGIGDELGRNATFDFSKANPNPPAGGSLAGFVVPNNFRGTVPPGVTQIGNNLGINGNGQNTINPRAGFAWQLPYTQRFVLRGGYGVYHSRVTGQPTFQLLTNQPFALVRQNVAFANAGASFANPFPAVTPVLPSFTPYSPTTSQSVFTFAPDFRPPMVQQYSLNLQSELMRNTMLEVGFIGTRGTHLLRDRDLNQAQSASPTNPIRGVTNNSFATAPLRVPIQGFGAFPGIAEFESEGANWYNALEASLNQRLSHGLQFQLSYTFSKDLATDLASTTGPNGGNGLVGDQNNFLRRYGPDSFNRPHRFVASYLYQLPGPKNLTSAWGRLAGGWAVSGVSIFQSGHPLTITASSPFNAFGISTDFPGLVPGCTIATPGGLEKNLNSYFNKTCFTPLPKIGPDPFTTGFGNSGVGIVTGPGQINTDLAIIKKFAVRWPVEAANLEFRTEFFNVFNHAQFADPDTNFSSATFGKIQTTAVNPRVMQFALKYSF